MKTKWKMGNVIFSLVFLLLGFMIAFSYQNTTEKNGKQPLSESQFERDLALRESLIEQEKENNSLYEKVKDKQNELLQIEKDLSAEAETYYNLAEDAEKYRMYLGKVPVKGEGVEITLADGQYNPREDNVNQYIVHEQHVFRVINELYIAGAQAISINGQRLTSHSYILCNGPVIEIDGYQHPAPFVITAIGEADVLDGAINMNGGAKDLLVNDNIVFSMERKEWIQMDSVRTK